MKITFAGVGNAFTDLNHFQSNFVITANSGKRLLVDCGGDARFSLAELGASNANIGSWLDGVYVSHVHADHMGGLEWIAFCTYFNPTVPRPKLYISPDLVDNLWDSLKHGFNSVKGVAVKLETFFDVMPINEPFKGYLMGESIERGRNFIWEGIKFELIKGDHVWANDKLAPVYGLKFGIGKFNDVYFTADTNITGDTIRACQESKLIFHDCETTPRISGVHAHYTQLVEQGYHLKEKMWLYHYSPNPPFDPVKDGFLGFVKKGQTFEI